MANCLPDFPPGPLDRYRKLASFDWKQLSLFLNGEEILNYQNEIYKEILKYPVIFEQPDETPTLNEIRRKATQKMFASKMIRDNVASKTNCNYVDKFYADLSMIILDPSVSIKRGLTFDLFTNAIASMGTERHRHFIESCLKGDILGCFGLTEIGHGSNTKGMRTTATYDPVAKQFVLHSPDFQAAKCWVGCLGQTATHGVIFAHLVTPDGTKHGLHAFVVPLRDPRTLTPYPGIKICDMGEKIGLNGIDNGLILFDQYSVPKENLLNKIGDVTDDGEYVTDFTDPGKKHGAALGNLSDGRIGITCANAGYLSKAVTIALRYAAVRKQFSASEDDEEVPILEYQSHQHRLLPHLATFYALRTFCIYLLDERYKFNLLLNEKNADNANKLTNRGLELHAMSSASKPLSGWYTRDAIQECREACAGHGYLKASGLGELRNNQDACCTYEGENHVLIQQTSNWLLRLWPLVLKGKPISTPINTVQFLNQAPQILTCKFTATTLEELTEPKNILDIFQWLVCYLLKTSFEKQRNLQQQSIHSDSSKVFWAKNDSQVFYAKSLSITYIQHLILTAMHNKILRANDLRIKNVLQNLFALFATTCLEKHIPVLYAGNYACGPNAAILIQDSILRLCNNIKNDAIALVDVIAPPDFILNSVLGYSDGQVYKHLESVMLRAPGALSRPSWWKEITNWKENVHSKL